MRAAWILPIVAACGVAVAQQDDDAAALALADRTHAEADAPRTCIDYAEAAVTDTTSSNPGPSSVGGRASLNIRCDGALGRQWRAVFSDRLDYFWAHGS